MKSINTNPAHFFLHRIYGLVFIFCLAWFSGCSSTYNAINDKIYRPRMIFAYTDATIYDQSKVATLLPDGLTVETIDGQKPSYWRQDGAPAYFRGMSPIDVLPGVHEITANFYTSSGRVGDGGPVTYTRSKKPQTITVDVKAGNIYKIGYRLNASTWDMYISDDVSDREKNNITECRNKIISKNPQM